MVSVAQLKGTLNSTNPIREYMFMSEGYLEEISVDVRKLRYLEGVDRSLDEIKLITGLEDVLDAEMKNELVKIGKTLIDIQKLLRPRMSDRESSDEARRTSPIVPKGKKALPPLEDLVDDTGGGGLAYGAGLALGRAGFSLGRGLAGAAGVVASQLLGNYIEDMTGSEALGDVAKWTGTGGSIGMMFGPTGALIGSLAGFAVGIGNEIISYLNERAEKHAKELRDAVDAAELELSDPVLSSSPGITAAQGAATYMNDLDPQEMEDWKNTVARAQSGDPVAVAQVREAIEIGASTRQNREMAGISAEQLRSAIAVLSEAGTGRQISDDTLNHILGGLSDLSFAESQGISNPVVSYDGALKALRDAIQNSTPEELREIGPEELGLSQTSFEKLLGIAELLNGGIDIDTLVPPRLIATNQLNANASSGGGAVIVAPTTSTTNQVNNSTHFNSSLMSSTDRRGFIE